MVVIKGTTEYVKLLMGKEIFEKLQQFSSVLGYEVEIDDEVRIEFNPDRSDLFSFVTLGESIRRYYYENKNDKFLAISNSKIKISNLNKDSNRKYIFHFEARGKKIGQYFQDLIDFHETISENVGRMRKKSAIGLHNMDNMQGPLTYSKVDSKTSFYAYDSDREGVLREIMKTHPKGTLYSSLSENNGKYLALLDKNGDIISIPPVLNSKKTRIDENSQNFLVDITSSELTQGKKLMLLSIYYFNSLGYEISTDSNFHKWKEFNNGFKEIKISGKEEISKLIGIKLEDTEISKNLSKMGYKTNNLSIRVPYYRIDVMGMVDISEDVAKSIGYNKIPELEIGLKSFGTPEKTVERVERISEIMVGMGFQETMSFFITSAKGNLENSKNDEFKIINPKSFDFSEIRKMLYPELLSFFERNLRRSYPQRIFEIGRVLIEDREEIHLA
ncbi:MAG: hypothetical protein ACYDDC_04665, partial [Thermoplasmataceae archaeon]